VALVGLFAHKLRFGHHHGILLGKTLALVLLLVIRWWGEVHGFLGQVVGEDEVFGSGNATLENAHALLGGDLVPLDEPSRGRPDGGVGGGSPACADGEFDGVDGEEDGSDPRDDGKEDGLVARTVDRASKRGGSRREGNGSHWIHVRIRNLSPKKKS